MEEILANLLLAHAPLAAMVGQNVDWDESPQGVTSARIVMTLVSSQDGYTYRGVDGLTRSRVQFDCHDDTPKKARALGRALDARLSGYSGIFEGVRVQGAFKVGHRSDAGKDGPRSWAMVQHDYFIWSASA